MKLIKGDLIEAFEKGRFDAIAHGCNCFCTMGSGIAKSIKRSFPEAYKADCKTIKGDKDKLGTCSNAVYNMIGRSEPIQVINCYTQYRYGTDKVHVDYKAVRDCMRFLNTVLAGKSLGLPKIGCGLAGGDWTIVKGIIEEELVDVDVTVMWI